MVIGYPKRLRYHGGRGVNHGRGQGGPVPSTAVLPVPPSSSFGGTQLGLAS